MSGTSTELVERLYLRLVQAAGEREGGTAGPFTVADLYQTLIPYRGVRGDLGVLELAQYEHALLRLLAGEGGFLRLRDEDARREVAAELRAPNPILGIYRDYAGVGVELLAMPDSNGREVAEAAGEPGMEQGSDDRRQRDVRDVAELVSEEADEEDDWGLVTPLPEMPYPPPRPAPADATRVVQPGAPPPPPAPVVVPRPGSPAATRSAGAPAPAPSAAPTAPPAATPAAGPSTAPTASPAPAPTSPAAPARRCVSCAEVLPNVEGLRFCPNCGTDQVDVPCARCATPIRGTWNFCIRCGAPRPAPAALP